MPLISCVQSIPTQYKDLIGIRCEFDVGQYGEQEFVQYGVYREPTLHSAVDSRCAEFIAGRYVAARALSELGGADADTYIGIGNQRCPVWPSGTVGSISHSRNVAVAFVSSSNHYQGVGVDVEPLMSSSTRKEVEAELMSTDELSVGGQADISAERWVSAVFAAKEAFFKAAYPTVQRFFGFEAVSVIAVQGGEWERGVSLTLRVNEDLAGPFLRQANFNVNLCLLPNQHVMALLLVSAQP